MKPSFTALLSSLLLLLSTSLRAQNQLTADATMAQDQGSLAAIRKAQSPVGDILKVQFQNFLNPGVGSKDVTTYTQFVVGTAPFKLNDSWNLFVRTQLPLMNQPSVAPGTESAFGLGDINPTFYLVPRKHGKLTLGAGPTFTFPTATAKVLGSGSWCVGPAAVAVVTSGRWLFGSRVNNQWSFAGWNKAGYNTTWIQPFMHYNLNHGWYFASLPTLVANWKASSGNMWTVPTGGGIGKHWKIGDGGLDAQLQAFANVKHPNGASSWQTYIEIQLVHPKHL
jgi:hypothetical protein